MSKRDKVLGADNQQGSRLAESEIDPSETTRRTPTVGSREEILAYLHGAMRDVSLNKGKRIRFVQKYREWLVVKFALLASSILTIPSRKRYFANG